MIVVVYTCIYISLNILIQSMLTLGYLELLTSLGQVRYKSHKNTDLTK